MTFNNLIYLPRSNFEKTHSATAAVSGLYLVIHLEAGEHGVFKANVYSHYMIDQCVRFVGLQRRGDGQSCSCISVQNVNQLLFLYCTWTGGKGPQSVVWLLIQHVRILQILFVVYDQ